MVRRRSVCCAPAISPNQPRGPVRLSIGAGRALAIAEIGRVELEPETLAEHLRATGGKPQRHSVPVRELLEGQDGPPPPHAQEFMQRFLFAVSHRDGFIEILGVPEWAACFSKAGRRLGAGPPPRPRCR